MTKLVVLIIRRIKHLCAADDLQPWTCLLVQSCSLFQLSNKNWIDLSIYSSQSRVITHSSFDCELESHTKMKTDTLLSPISTLKAVFPWQQLMTPADKLTKTGQYTVLQFVAGKQFCGAVRRQRVLKITVICKVICFTCHQA